MFFGSFFGGGGLVWRLLSLRVFMFGSVEHFGTVGLLTVSVCSRVVWSRFSRLHDDKKCRL